MIEIFMGMLLKHKDEDLELESSRRKIACALLQKLQDEHIVMHTDLEARCRDKEENLD